MTCVSRDGVSLHADGRLGQLGGHLVVAFGQERSARLQRLQGHRAEIERFEAQVDLAEVDARDVQQVVDQPRELRDLPRDRLARPDLAVVLRAGAGA